MQIKSFINNLVSGIGKRVSKAKADQNSKAGLNWWKEKYLKHTVENGIKWYYYKHQKIYYKRPLEFLYSLKEIFVNEVYKIDLPENPYIIDCGSNIGLSIIYFKEKFPGAEIIALEPDESNFQLLVKNIESFNLDNISLRKQAVWVKNEELKFSNDGTMASKIERTNTQKAKKIEAIRLKDLLNRKVDLLKIDIEGAEYLVLKDISDNLVNVDHLFLEYHGTFEQGNQLVETLGILQKNKFHFYIKEAAEIYKHPMMAARTKISSDYDVQLNIFCFR